MNINNINLCAYKQYMCINQNIHVFYNLDKIFNIPILGI